MKPLRAPYPWFGTTAMDRAVYMLGNGFLTLDDEGRFFRTAILSRGKWHSVPLRRAENVGGKGYLRLSLSIPGKGLKSVMAHRVVWQWLVGPIPDGLQINHKDFAKQNNCICNLELVDQSGNIHHSYESGNRPRPWCRTSEWRGRPRVSEEKQAELLSQRRSGLLYRQIAADAGLSITHVQRIIKRKEGEE
jgi:hypothetical protein